MNGEAIQLMQDLGNTDQQFRMIKLSNGYCSILNMNSNKANLDFCNLPVVLQ